MTCLNVEHKTLLYSMSEQISGAEKMITTGVILAIVCFSLNVVN